MRSPFDAWFARLVRWLHPGAFAFVMATGIISNAMFLVGQRELSAALFDLNAVAFPWLGLLLALRLVRFPHRVLADLADPRLVFAFFSLVAAADVFGMGLGLRGFRTATGWIWAAALGLWLPLIYLGFGVLVFRNNAERTNVIDGGWLMGIVGTESLVIAGAAAAPLAGGLSPAVFVLIHVLWGVGLGLYAVFVVLFAYRVFFFEVGPDDLTPLLWVVMGAAAIGANAGSALILGRPDMRFLAAMRPFIEGVTLCLWAWASWWIPLLVAFGVWKHLILRRPLAYSPLLWSLVFPLGMYAVASLRLSLASDFPPWRVVANAMVWVALAAWVATAGGLLRRTWLDVRAARFA